MKASGSTSTLAKIFDSELPVCKSCFVWEKVCYVVHIFFLTEWNIELPLTIEAA
jgi:hypothetical protein